MGLHLVVHLGLVGEPDVFVTLTLGNDFVVETHARVTTSKLVDLETVRCFVRNVKALAVALGGQEDVILDAGVHGLSKCWIQGNACHAARETAGAVVFEPIFRRLDGGQRYVPTVFQLQQAGR